MIWISYREEEYIIRMLASTFLTKRFEKAIIGISGGIDSAVVAKLLVKTLGKENVIGLLLPYGEQKDIEDSYKICSLLGIEYKEINIKPMVNSFFSTDPSDNIKMGNVKARIRMIYLYDRAVEHNALVVGTGNKTELMLGYFTLHGDGACAVEPIGHLLKTEVRQLARRLNIPEHFISKPPSAGLWEGQTDEEELGYSYEEIDSFLYDYYINKSLTQVLHYPLSFMSKIIERVEKNKFKLEGSVIFDRLCQ